MSKNPTTLERIDDAIAHLEKHEKIVALQASIAKWSTSICEGVEKLRDDFERGLK